MAAATFILHLFDAGPECSVAWPVRVGVGIRENGLWAEGSGPGAEYSWRKQSLTMASDFGLGFDSMEPPYFAKYLEDLPLFHDTEQESLESWKDLALFHSKSKPHLDF